MTAHDAAPRRRKMATASADVSEQEKRLWQDVRAAYISERRSYETGITGKVSNWSPPRSYGGCEAVTTDDGDELEPARESIWASLVRFLCSRKIDPVAYVQYIFQNIAWTVRAPEPNNLKSEKMLQLWHDGAEDRSRYVIQSLPTQRAVALGEFSYWKLGKLSDVDAYVCTLTHNGLSLSPLFRYCLARQLIPSDPEAFKPIAKQYLIDAVRQFFSDSEAYTRYWVGVLPEGFIEKAKRVYSRYF